MKLKLLLRNSFFFKKINNYDVILLENLVKIINAFKGFLILADVLVSEKLTQVEDSKI